MPVLEEILPSHLLERLTSKRTEVRHDDAAYVLYWMRTAVRAHENAALDVALVTANKLGLPVLVYHGLDERYPYASDRFHTFILEGARDVQKELDARGIFYALNVRREGHREDNALEDLRRGLEEAMHAFAQASLLPRELIAVIRLWPAAMKLCICWEVPAFRSGTTVFWGPVVQLVRTHGS